MFIDIHVHAFRKTGLFRGSQVAFSTPAQLIERFDQLGIERAVVLPMVNPECSHGVQDVEDVLEMGEAFAGRFIPFCNVDPRAVSNAVNAPLGEILRYYKDNGCKGIGELCANLPFLDPMVQNLFHHAQDLDLPVTFHIAPTIGGNYGLYDEPGLPQLELSLRQFPKLKFLGHSQAFWAEMGRLDTPGDRWVYPKGPIREEGVVPKLMRRYENLYGDLSAGSGYYALYRDPDYAIGFLNEFQDRLLFGTDLVAPDTPAPLVDFLLDLRREGRLNETVFAKIARENAVKLLGL